MGLDLEAAAGPAGMALGAVQGVVGMVQSAVGNARLKKLMQKRTAYTTPEEFFDILNMAQNQAQTGYDAATMKYLTDNQDRGLSGSLASLSRLGGDQNAISAIFDKNLSAIMKTSADSELVKLQKFTKLYDAVATIGKEKTAEWADKEAQLKDQMAAAGMKVKAGADNTKSGTGLITGGLMAAMDYYKNNPKKPKSNEITGAGAFNAPTPEYYQTHGPSADELPSWLIP